MIRSDDEYNHSGISTLRDDNNRPWYRRRWAQISAGVTLLVIVIIAISVPASKNKKTQSAVGGEVEGPIVPAPQVPPQTLQSNRDSFGNTLLTYYQTYDMEWEVLQQQGSPQNIALEWVAGSANFDKLDRPQRVQRFVLAVFYYSTFKQANFYFNENNGDTILGWTSALNWISDERECDWEGITCEGDAVTGILLREHRLSGTLPLEMAFLATSLQTIDLTSNFVYIDGDANPTPLSHLDEVTTLLLEDNYFVSSIGIPTSIGEMTSLRKLVLSYNILQGPLDGSVFSKLSQLTHLEVESNFLNGQLPSELLDLQNLVYVYIRSNYLDLVLPTILANGTWPSLFALWLDSNNVVGPIPASIASKTDLASLSITNTTLNGPIPSELGELTGLRRVWLYQNRLTGKVPAELASLVQLEVLEVYDNQLSGPMPSGVCSVIAGADYEFKALSADCDKISCDNCCTECF